MSKPLVTIDPNASIRDVARLMIKNQIRRLPIANENVLVGIIVASDFARQLSRRSITEEILDAMARYAESTEPYTHPVSYAPPPDRI